MNSRAELERQIVEQTAELEKKNVELAQTREALANAQGLLQAMLDNIPDLIYYKDSQSRFLKVNRALARHLSVENPDMAIGKTDFDFNSPERAREFLKDEQRIFQTGVPLINKIEKQLLLNGTTLWTSTTKAPLRDSQGKIVGLVGISRNITEQKQAEEVLRQSHDELEQHVAERTAELSRERRLLRTLIDNLPDGIYAKDREGRKTLANKADLKTLRCKTEAEAIGKSDFDLFPKEIAAKFFADDQAVIQKGQPVLDREEFFFDEENRKHWLLTSKLPLRDENGVIVGLVGVGRDITQLKQAEEALRQARDELEQQVTARTAENADLQKLVAERERAEQALGQERRLLRTLIDNLPDGIYAKDREGRKTLANKADLKTLRCKTEAEAIGKNDFDLFPKEIAARFFADDQAVIAGNPVINREEFYLDEAGQKHWLLTSKLPFKDETGAIVGLVGIGRDISSLKVAEERLEAVHRELRDVSRQAGMAEVATGVLHNVGNVLNSVNVAAGVVSEVLRNSRSSGVSKLTRLLVEHKADLGHFLSEDERGHQVPAYLEQLSGYLEQERSQMRAELDNLMRNIEHIKEIVATQQNYAKVLGVVEKVELSDLMEDAMKIHGGAFERHGITLVREYDPLPPMSVDKHKLLQIVVNLLSNAKYACEDSNQNTNRVCVRLKAGGEGRVRIEVEDNGIGIAKGNLARIFSQGFTTRKGGHGFGLHGGALAAREMGGSLTAHSDGPGKGATFVIDLPLVPPDNESQKSTP
jgi:PAS domain S-box-containing protein